MIQTSSLKTSFFSFVALLAIFYANVDASTTNSDCVEEDPSKRSTLVNFSAFELIRQDDLAAAKPLCGPRAALDALDRVSSELSMLSKRITFCGMKSDEIIIAINLSFFRRLNQNYGTTVTESIAQLINESISEMCLTYFDTLACVERVSFNSFAVRVKASKVKALQATNGKGPFFSYASRIEKNLLKQLKRKFNDLIKQVKKDKLHQDLDHLSTRDLKLIGSSYVFDSKNPGVQVGIGKSFTTAYIIARINRYHPNHKQKNLRDLILWVEDSIKREFNRLSNSDRSVLFSIDKSQTITGFNPEAVLAIRDAFDNKSADKYLRERFMHTELSSEVGRFFSVFEWVNTLSPPHFEAATFERKIFRKMQADASELYRGVKKVRVDMEEYAGKHGFEAVHEKAFIQELTDRLKPVKNQLRDIFFGNPYRSLKLLSSIRQTGELFSSYSEEVDEVDAVLVSEKEVESPIMAVVMSLDIRGAANFLLPLRNRVLRDALKPDSYLVRKKRVEESFLPLIEDMMYTIGSRFFNSQIQVVDLLKAVVSSTGEEEKIFLGQTAIAPYVTGDDVTVVFFLKNEDGVEEKVTKTGLKIERAIAAEAKVNLDFPKIRSAASFMEVNSKMSITKLHKVVTELAQKNQMLISKHIKPKEKLVALDPSLKRIFAVAQWAYKPGSKALGQKVMALKEI